MGSGSLRSDGGNGVAGHLVNAGDILGRNGVALAFSDQRRDGGEQFADPVYKVVFSKAFVREIIKFFGEKFYFQYFKVNINCKLMGIHKNLDISRA